MASPKMVALTVVRIRIHFECRIDHNYLNIAMQEIVKDKLEIGKM